jgi:hypothetical protein
VRESPEDVEVTDGDSALTVRHEDRECLVSLGESFADKPSLLQRNFWAFAIAKLLRTVGLFALHGAGVIGANGVAALLVGPSGSGKSTLAIGLAQAGWQVLSDDALVLRQTRGGIEALGLRKKLYIDGADSDRYAEFGLTPAPRDRKGGARFQLDLGANTSTSTNVPVTPRFLVFPTISRRETSQGRRIDAPDTVGRLLEASGPQLLDRALMEPHLEVLSRLAKQAVAIDLQSGADLHKQPERLVELLDASASSDRECGLYPQQANT